MTDALEFRGSYQYATVDMLDIALHASRLELESERCPGDLEWPDCFSQAGTTIYVHASLPAQLRTFFSTNVLRCLAHSATQGAVEVVASGVVTEFMFVKSIARRDDVVL